MSELVEGGGDGREIFDDKYVGPVFVLDIINRCR